MENLSPRAKRFQKREQRQQQQEQMEQQRMEQQSESQSQSPQSNDNDSDNGIIRELSSRTDSLLQTESQSVSQQLQQQSNNNNNNQPQLDHIEENINININNNNNQQQLQFQGLGFLSNDYFNILTSSLNGFYNETIQHNVTRLKLGAFAENINYIIQKNKRFSKNNIHINGLRIKFNYKSIMEALFIDDTIPKSIGFINGKFSSIGKIKALRTATERHYESNNNTLLGIDNQTLTSYQTAVAAKRTSVCFYI